MRPQVPQLFRSVFGSTQLPEQSTSPIGQVTCESVTAWSDATSTSLASGGAGRSSRVASIVSVATSFDAMSTRVTSATSGRSAGVEHATEASANNASADDAHRERSAS